MPLKKFKELRESLQKINVNRIVNVLVKLIMFSISITAMFIEAQFDYVKIKSFVSPPFDWVLSFMLPVFTAFGFESAIILKRDGAKGTSRIIKVMAGFSMAFSLVMITAGQFDKNNDLLNAKIEDKTKVEVSTRLYDFNIAEQERLSGELENLIIQSNENAGKLARVEFNGQEYWTIWGIKDKIDKQIVIVKTSLTDVSNDIRESLESGEIETVKKSETTIYDIVAGIFKTTPELVQFVLFMILPVFIVFMAPLGMYVALGLYKIGTVKQPRQKRSKKSVDWKSLIETWVKHNWMALRINNYYHILTRDSFYGLIAQKGGQFPKFAYNRILKSAIKTGCITSDENILLSDESEVIEKIALDTIV